MTLPVCVAALYRFTRLADIAALREPLLNVCNEGGVKGTLLLAAEGINGTIAGSQAAIARVIAHIRTVLPDCDALEVKYSRAETMPFHRMKVRLKREIVTMGQPDIDPLKGVGHYVAPADWNALIADPDTIVIDTRNDYEVAIGSFKGAINPRTASFRDFPAWFREQRATLIGQGKAPKVAMFCTGGIRCEKSTAFLKSEGLDEVYHLQGGILKYLEDVPAEQSLWEGECFVFDQRVSVGHGLTLGSHDLCHACRRPVNATDKASPLYVDGVSCPACHDERNDAQRAGYAERARQTKLAEKRGETHIGAIYPDKD
ncbi:rhodanese-related sulfurtransferase [Sphingomonas sp. LaA6.9]|uniref:oxygen-dependent tRNA uridine(34) hydroxylase TrhO n=1 Tax=Sphingomonas sp. LaA6.9 TaxID=2919914 RepID=UPI001F4F9E05|nr:rhodanese-related sulfurtransferase [Sphingomonas sp. LaA6.9]MCJ8157112.1 rhodanese-related sulfurtransferase [Sphingomonas sp. LaA6.9]